MRLTEETFTAKSRLRRTAKCEVGTAECEVGTGQARLEGKSLASVNGPMLLPWFRQKHHGNLREWHQEKLSQGFQSPLNHLCNFSAKLKSLQSKKFIQNINK